MSKQGENLERDKLQSRVIAEWKIEMAWQGKSSFGAFFSSLLD